MAGEKIINTGSNVPLGDQKLKHMTMELQTSAVPVDFNTFKELPHHGWDSDAPVRNALVQSNYFFRFRKPPGKWMVGRAIDRRIIHCWYTDFAPIVSHRDRFVNEFVHEVGHIEPKFSGHFGTLKGSEMMSAALAAAPEDLLWEWLVYKEKQRRGEV